MLYCENCQVLSRDGKTCPVCGGKKLRPVRPDDPVLLITVGEEESARISAAFQDAAIPCFAQAQGAGSVLSILGGQPRSTARRVFVPFGEVEHAREVLIGIGALKEGASAKPPEPEREEQPMSRGRRAAARIFFAVVFLAVIWIVVYFCDILAGYLKNFFH
mgnify:FL=1